MSKKTVLIIDDEENMRHMLKIMLEKSGYAAQGASDGLAALDMMKSELFDVILCDIKMPKMGGMEFLAQAIKTYPEKTYIMMSAYGTMDSALEAIKNGAYDYISKPFRKNEVLLTLKKAEERERLKDENRRLKTKIDEIEEKYSFNNIIARSEVMANIFDLVRKVADHKTTVLITGESGTGKELIARALHSNSHRLPKPLVTINCGGIPGNLLESELFGYKKGAFTDAVKDKPGQFKEANQGSIFLDEIGELPLTLQVKLLRVLQEEEITPLGGTGAEKIDVRIIAATSRNLAMEVSEGRFREDLYYRINVMTIHLPPLRERKGDIPLLAGYFIDCFNKKLGKEIEGLSSETMSLLMLYLWPGNVRELENLIERALLLANGRWITPDELPLDIKNKKSFPEIDVKDIFSIKEASRRLQKELITKALNETAGNRTKAAKLLEISRPMLLSRIKEYDL